MCLPVKKWLFGGREVGNIHINGHLVDALVLLDPEGLSGGLVSSEIRRLVHVEPYS